MNLTNAARHALQTVVEAVSRGSASIVLPRPVREELAHKGHIFTFTNRLGRRIVVPTPKGVLAVDGGAAANDPLTQIGVRHQGERLPARCRSQRVPNWGGYYPIYTAETNCRGYCGVEEC